MSGILYLCGTPIGNLEDMSVRAIRTLREVDLIAAEDTRNSIRLLNHFEIDTPMTSYHEYNRYDKAKVLIEKLQKGQDIALITDAGMPGISDPGEELTAMCAEAGIAVTAIPGPSAVVTAVALSGLSTRRFVFEGFLPTVKKERRERLEMLQSEVRTIVLYEAPHHLEKTLSDLSEVFGSDRKISLCRELTKLHETIHRTTIGEALIQLQEIGPRGEYVLVIDGKDPNELKQSSYEEWQKMPLSDHMKLYEEQGMGQKEAMKQVAKDRGLTKRDVYQALFVKK